MQVRFDAYTATTGALNPNVAMDCLMFQADTVKQFSGHHGFGHRFVVTGADGHQTGSIQYGGQHPSLVMIEVKGERTPAVVEKLRALAPLHNCTRVDSCVDFEFPGAFDSLLERCTGVKKDHKLRGSKAGDWDDFPEDGRTLYLGASASVARARLYEKGLQPEYRHLNRSDYVRLELQVRPSKDAKQIYSELDALQVWGCSRWTRDLAARVLEAQVLAHPAGTIRRETTRDRALRFMCKQYGAHIMSLMHEHGSFEEVGRHLHALILDEKEL